jgi:hypothetical protein
MAVTRERFDQGMTFDAYKAQMTRNQEQFERNAQIALSEQELAPFKSLTKPLNVLVLAEDWCGDVVANLPILGAIAKQSGKLNLKVFVKDDNKDLIAQYMNGPYESVPVFAFFDQEMNPLGVWIERPKSVAEVRVQKTREIHEQNPEFGPYGAAASDLPEDARNRLQQAIQQMRADTVEFAKRETVRELGEMVTDFSKGVPAGGPQWRGNLAAVTA